jgi:hypothetical protein
VPSYFVIGSLDTWQLIIKTATTIAPARRAAGNTSA